MRASEIYPTKRTIQPSHLNTEELQGENANTPLLASYQTKSQRNPEFRTFNGQFRDPYPVGPAFSPAQAVVWERASVVYAPSCEMDVPEERYYGNQTPDRSDTNSPRSQMSSPNSSSSINVTDQTLSLSQHQQNLETLNRMGMFFHAQQMHLNQSFESVKSRLGLTQVPNVSQGPRHTIDAILGLNGGRPVNRVQSDFEQRREECEPVPVSPGAVESAGKSK
ncbi:hypothetical protein ACJJTC_004293 [Scirpophaga incertulas]